MGRVFSRVKSVGALRLRSVWLRLTALCVMGAGLLGTGLLGTGLLGTGLLGVGLVGCKGGGSGVGSPGGAVQEKTYHLRGKIVAESVADGSLTVSAGAIPGYMEAMTMSYKLVQPNIMSELHVGDLITADVVVDYDSAGPMSPKLDHLVVVGQARPDTKPTVQYHVPQAGDKVPNFALLNQSDKTIHLDQFKGKVVLLTFIYTRCPIADYCPRMSANFAEIDKDLAQDKSVYAKTHLVSVSFDPKYDTPQVLRSYGGAHTGRFTEEDFKHWDFAAPSVPELPKMEEWFDVGVTGDSSQPSTIQHSLSTVVIGKDGKVLAWYPTNDWKVADVLKQVEAAAG
jgi:protein SCO1/2